MRFMMIVKSAERSGPPPKELMDAMGKLAEESIKSGEMIDSGGLGPSAAGTRVRLRNGKISVTDGPFTEAKEVVGGYWMIQVKSKEEAIEWASRCPASDNEIIEIRQVQEFSEFPADVQGAASGFAEMQSKPGQRGGS